MSHAEKAKLTGYGRSVIGGNKTTKRLCDESLTDQEHKFGDRADQAQRVHISMRSISFDFFIFGGAYFLRFTYLMVSLKRKSLVVLAQSCIIFSPFKVALLQYSELTTEHSL